MSAGATGAAGAGTEALPVKAITVEFGSRYAHWSALVVAYRAGAEVFTPDRLMGESTAPPRFASAEAMRVVIAGARLERRSDVMRLLHTSRGDNSSRVSLTNARRGAARLRATNRQKPRRIVGGSSRVFEILRRGWGQIGLFPDDASVFLSW
jgi:hypothetical protein